jgi:hypothetical protein
MAHHFAERFCGRWGHPISMDRFTETGRLLVRLQQWSHVRKVEGCWQAFRPLHCVAIPFEFRAKSSRGFRTRMTRAQTAWVTWVEPVIVEGDTSAGWWCPAGFTGVARTGSEIGGPGRVRPGCTEVRLPLVQEVDPLLRSDAAVAWLRRRFRRAEALYRCRLGALFRDGRSVNPGEGLRTSSQAARLEGVG